MKAVVFEDYGQELKVAELPKPTLKNEKYMLVRVKAAG